MKFFVEFFRSSKWRRTGLIWWNLIDGWPQFSDAVVDYYFEKKRAYHFIKRSQAPLCLMLREPENSGQDLVASNDTRGGVELEYKITDVDTGEVLAGGCATAAPDAVTLIDRIPFSAGRRRFYAIKWTGSLGTGLNHYLAGNPPFSLAAYRRWLESLSP